MSDSLLWERGMSQLQMIMFPGLIFKLVVEIYKTFLHRSNAVNKALRLGQIRKAHLS